MFKLISFAAVLAAFALPAFAASPAFTPEELAKLEAFLAYACKTDTGKPSLLCARDAIALFDKAMRAQAPAEEKK